MAFLPLSDERHRGYVLTVLIAMDEALNAILNGRKHDTISARIGRSIALGGWASRLPWPASWRKHFLAVAEG